VLYRGGLPSCNMETKQGAVSRLVVGDAVYAWNAEKGKIMYCLTGIRGEGKSFMPKMVNKDNQ